MTKIQIHILVPYYNFIQGIQRIEKDFSNQNFKRITISDDSVNSAFTYKENWISGPKAGAVKNWNFLLEHSDCEHNILLHQDERIKILDDTDLYYLRTDTVYVSDLILNDHKRHIVLNGKLRAWLMQHFPKLIYYINYIGPTATLIVPKNNQRFNENLKWLVDVDYYYHLRKKYRFEYTRSFQVESDISIMESITKSGSLGNIKKLQKDEERMLELRKNKLVVILLKILWHLFRRMRTFKL